MTFWERLLRGVLYTALVAALLVGLVAGYRQAQRLGGFNLEGITVPFEDVAGDFYEGVVGSFTGWFR